MSQVAAEEIYALARAVPAQAGRLAEDMGGVAREPRAINLRLVATRIGTANLCAKFERNDARMAQIEHKLERHFLKS